MSPTTRLLGISGNSLLSLCGIPLLISTMTGGSHTSYWFIAAWGLGEIFAFTFGLRTGVSRIILGNYIVSMLLIVAITVAQLAQ
jgi:hypothetical protein